jgi:hypothetical protein
MTAVFVTSIAGLFAWATIIRLWLWLGHADADSGLGSPASLGHISLGCTSSMSRRFLPNPVPQ